MLADASGMLADASGMFFCYCTKIKKGQSHDSPIP